MTQLLVLIFVLSFGRSAFAGRTVRAAQKRLKHWGYYSGKADGVYNSETAAAVMRYQIGHWLEMNGQIDFATAESLGIKKPPVPIPPPFPDARSATALIGDPATGALVLSRERLRNYIAAFILAGLKPEGGAELAFFGERVDYFGDGIVNRDAIQRDLQSYDARWPERHFWLAGELEVQPQPDSRIRVLFPLRFDVRNGTKRASGEVLKTLVLEVIDGNLQIVGVKERRRPEPAPEKLATPAEK